MDNIKFDHLSQRGLILKGLVLAGGVALAGSLSRCGGEGVEKTGNLSQRDGTERSEEFIRLAFNENPLGPCEAALGAMEAARTNDLTLTGLNRYPDFLHGDLLEAIGDFHGLRPKNVVPGCGSSEVLNIIAACFLRDGGVLLTPSPTFGLPAARAGFLGTKVKEIEIKDDHTFDLENIIREVTQETRVIYLCNPNNPTGTIIKQEDLEVFLESVWYRNSQTIVVMDEAYCHYANDPDFPSSEDYLGEGPIVIVRTFSHAYGLAGVRVGYSLAPQTLAYEMGGITMESLSKTGFHWKLGANVNRIGEAATIASLKYGGDHIARTRELNRKIKTIYYNAFSDLGFEYIPSEANFVLFNAAVSGDRMQAYFYRNGILVQAGRSHHPRYSNWVRVSTGTVEEAQRFVEVLMEYRANSPIAEDIPSFDFYGY